MSSSRARGVTVPLSEQEQRLLEEMERSLYHNDSDFVATVGDRSLRPDYRMIVIGILVGLVGIVGVIVGVATHVPLIGIVGFVVMFFGALLALRKTKGPEVPSESQGRVPAERHGFMDRMNERWDKRQGPRGN